MEREKITLSGAQETMLATLYSRALDCRARDPVLGDQEAVRAVRRIDYDFRRTGMTATTAAVIAVRAKRFDDWTAEFLADQPRATVLHLACGLDTRVHRLRPPATTRWIDVDYPEVLELRERLLPRPAAADYRTIGASVTDEGWLERVPADRPTVILFEGLSMYLRKEEGKRLVQRTAGRFPSGRLLFDCLGSLGIWSQKLVPAIRNAGATLSWAVDDPREIEGWHPGLVCMDAPRGLAMPDNRKVPRPGRWAIWLMARLPVVRDVSRNLRYRF